MPMLFPPSDALSVGSSPSQLSANLTWLASITPSLVHQNVSSFNWMDALNQQRLQYRLHYVHSDSSVSISKHLWAQPHLTIPICNLSGSKHIIEAKGPAEVYQLWVSKTTPQSFPKWLIPGCFNRCITKTSSYVNHAMQHPSERPGPTQRASGRLSLKHHQIISQSIKVSK